MEAIWRPHSFGKPLEQKWSKMLILSTVFHLAIFSFAFLLPEPMPTRRIKGPVYEVNLVEMPRSKQSKLAGAAKTKAKKTPLKSKKATPAKRILSPKKEEKPIVIAKRVIETKKKGEKKPEISSSKVLDQTLARLEQKVKAAKKDPLEQAIAKLASRTRGEGIRDRPVGQGADSGITIRIYQMDVENRIKGNWSYPVALLDPDNREGLESIMVVGVKSDGTILNTWFKKRSSNVIFNQSVAKAIERSNPLPPFPEGYRKTYDEIEINFNLRDLEAY